jgi:hypothetical protein
VHYGVTNKQHAETIENKPLTEKEKRSVTNKQLYFTGCFFMIELI